MIEFISSPALKAAKVPFSAAVRVGDALAAQVEVECMAYIGKK